MPNIKSAKKRVKVIATKTMKNQMQKSSLKSTLKKFEVALNAGDKAALDAAYIDAVKKVDKAAAKGILHKNTAARKKSLLARKMAV